MLKDYCAGCYLMEIDTDSAILCCENQFFILLIVAGNNKLPHKNHYRLLGLIRRCKSKPILSMCAFVLSFE